MARSNVPQALSVVSVTHEGDVERTVKEIMLFDDADFGFSHAKTWSAMPAALRGIFTGEQVARQYTRAHPRVAKSIAALCVLGQARPVTTFDLRDHPNAGIRPVQGMRIGPGVIVAAKATCWYVKDDRAVIPILQPRKAGLSQDKLAIYARLARLAFCTAEWASADIEIVDLSGDDRSTEAVARVLSEASLPHVEDDRVVALLRTYAEAHIIASEERAKKPKPQRRRPSDQPMLFENPPREIK